jgi:hypothetical protein
MRERFQGGCAGPADDSFAEVPVGAAAVGPEGAPARLEAAVVPEAPDLVGPFVAFADCPDKAAIAASRFDLSSDFCASPHGTGCTAVSYRSLPWGKT